MQEYYAVPFATPGNEGKSLLFDLVTELQYCIKWSLCISVVFYTNNCDSDLIWHVDKPLLFFFFLNNILENTDGVGEMYFLLHRTWRHNFYISVEFQFKHYGRIHQFNDLVAQIYW